MDLVTASEISKRLGFHERTVRGWLKLANIEPHVAQYKCNGYPVRALYDYKAVLDGLRKIRDERGSGLQELDYVRRRWQVHTSVVMGICQALEIQIYVIRDRTRNRNYVTRFDAAEINKVLRKMYEANEGEEK